MWTLWTTLALAGSPAEPLEPGPSGTPVVRADWTNGRLSERVAWGDGADLVLLYGGERAGRVGPCGCEEHPIGGLPRLAGYRAALRDANPGVPDLLLDPGASFSARTGDTAALSDDARAANRHARAGMEAVGFDAVNVTCRDLPGAAADGFPPGALSTNLRVDGLPDRRVLTAGDHDVAVLGVGPACLDYLQPDGLAVTDPLQAVAALAPTLEADLVVVLAYELAGRVEALAGLEGVDVVIEAGAFTGRSEPYTVGDAVWVRSAHETQRVKELRIRIDDGRVTAAADRTITLDDGVPDDRTVRRLLKPALQHEAAAD